MTIRRRIPCAAVVLAVACVTACSGGQTSAPAPSTGGSATSTDVSAVRVEPDLTYRTSHGPEKMDVYFPPKGKHPTPHPGIVFVHGGGWISGKRVSLASSARVAAAHGYLGFNISYQTKKPNMRREARDVESAIADIRARADQFGLDPDRLAALGASAGAQLVMQAAVTDHSGLSAAIGWSGPYDLTKRFVGPHVPQRHRRSLERTVDQVLGCPHTANPRACHAARVAFSPALHTSKHQPPLLLFNSADELVAAGQMRSLAANSRAHGDRVLTHLVPGHRHAEAYHAQAIGPTLRWLDTL